jgi:SulP family sulfate permease
MRLYGSLFFGAVAKVEHAADDLPTGTRAVVLEMHQLVSMDTTGLDALHQLHRTLARQGVALVLCALNEQPAGLVERSGFGASLGAGHRVQTLGEAFALARQQARSQANCAR